MMLESTARRALERSHLQGPLQANIDLSTRQRAQALEISDGCLGLLHVSAVSSYFILSFFFFSPRCVLLVRRCLSRNMM